jgi:hypothetical protein
VDVSYWAGDRRTGRSTRSSTRSVLRRPPRRQAGRRCPPLIPGVDPSVASASHGLNPRSTDVQDHRHWPVPLRARSGRLHCHISTPARRASSAVASANIRSPHLWLSAYRHHNGCGRCLVSRTLLRLVDHIGYYNSVATRRAKPSKSAAIAPGGRVSELAQSTQ